MTKRAALAFEFAVSINIQIPAHFVLGSFGNRWKKSTTIQALEMHTFWKSSCCRWTFLGPGLRVMGGIGYVLAMVALVAGHAVSFDGSPRETATASAVSYPEGSFNSLRADDVDARSG
jgi:hypothetical protein